MAAEERAGYGSLPIRSPSGKGRKGEWGHMHAMIICAPKQVSEVVLLDNKSSRHGMTLCDFTSPRGGKLVARSCHSVI
jgi:hypothetical protein